MSLVLCFVLFPHGSRNASGTIKRHNSSGIVTVFCKRKNNKNGARNAKLMFINDEQIRTELEIIKPTDMNDGRNQRKETQKHLLGAAFVRCVLNTLN